MPFKYFDHNHTILVRNRNLMLLHFLLLLTVFPSCKKKAYEGNPATIQVFNAMDNGLRLYANLSGVHPIQYKTSLLVGNKFYMLDNNLITTTSYPQRIDFYSIPDTMPHDRPLLNVNAAINAGEIYSLFLYGDKSTPGYSLVKDNIPAINRQDSTTHLRFANFSEAQAISVNIQGQANGSFIQNLSFKSLSDFVELDADITVANYVFEIRNQATGALLATFTTFGLNPAGGYPGSVNNWIFKSNTIVFTGKPGSAFPNSPRVSTMNHR